MNQLENCQARYRSNTWMGRTRTDGPDEFEPSKFDCMSSRMILFLLLVLNYCQVMQLKRNGMYKISSSFFFVIDDMITLEKIKKLLYFFFWGGGWINCQTSQTSC